MKHLFKTISLLFALLLVISCTDVEKAQFATDSTAPGIVSNCNVINGAGKALITYDLPTDEDLLYVKATYKLNDGTNMEVKASAYINELEVVGFGKAAEHDITLIAVDRSGNESEPVVVKISPADNPIYEIFSQMKVTSDFGGLAFNWENKERVDITITVTTPDEHGQMITAQNFYSNSKIGQGYIRGYSTETSETEGRRFAVVISDHWGNQTAIKDSLYFPIYETEISSDRYAKYIIPGYGDPGRYNSSSDWPKLWNGSWGTNNDHYHTKVGLSSPINLGMNLGRLVKLSRIKYYQRSGGSKWQYLYAHGNPKRFRVWGTPTTDGVQLDITEPGNDRILLTEFTSVKPSGLPLGSTNADDQQLGGLDGEDVLIPIDAPAVRWIRLEVLETWGGVTDFVHIAELTYYGKEETN